MNRIALAALAMALIAWIYGDIDSTCGDDAACRYASEGVR